MKKNLAWHFVGATLRDGTPVPADGVWLKHAGKLEMCISGLHFSREPFDALQYAPGETLCLVEIDGEIVEPKGENKGICSRRKILTRMEATELLRYFARMQALSVIHLNLNDEDLPDVVYDFLMTGDEDLRAAAKAATFATMPASWDAAFAAWDATRPAAWNTARAASWGAAFAARDATRPAAWEAAWITARAALAAASEAASGEAAWGWAIRQYFNGLVYECFEDWL